MYFFAIQPIFGFDPRFENFRLNRPIKTLSCTGIPEKKPTAKIPIKTNNYLKSLVFNVFAEN